jgi:hypothetical protein
LDHLTRVAQPQPVLRQDPEMVDLSGAEVVQGGGGLRAGHRHFGRLVGPRFCERWRCYRRNNEKGTQLPDPGLYWTM